MKRLFLFLLLLGGPLLRAQEEYPPGPDSKPQEGIPKGELLKFTFDRSRIFPGTTREYSVYVPKQYDPSKLACLFVDQDGVQFSAPTVFDNLISRGEIPVVIGVFITPGVVKSPAENALDRYNRSYEYDGLGDAYVKFLTDELLPEVETKTTADGRPIRFSKVGNDRMIAGSSSGAIAAFTAAWERPEAFARVFSSIGTYVGLRGGNVYPTWIRKFEPKPLRVFLQDGSHDQNIYGGDWWMANQEMERALTFAGYEVNHVWGEGGHNGQQATQIFPDAMRWLWKDWPKPIAAGLGSAPLQEILLPGEGWQAVEGAYKETRGLAVNGQGELIFSDVTRGNARAAGSVLDRASSPIKRYRLGADGKVAAYGLEGARGDLSRGEQAFGPDGRLYALETRIEPEAAGQPPGAAQAAIVAYDAQGQGAVVAKPLPGNNLIVRHDGSLYVTEPAGEGAPAGRITYLSPGGEKREVDTGLAAPGGLALSPDQTLLYVSDASSHWVYSYQIAADGSLSFKQRYDHLDAPDAADDSGAEGMTVDAGGRLYVATRLGVQVCDQAGRVNCIVPTPNGKVTGLAIGGPAFDTLYAACGEKVFQRKLKVKGAPAFFPPIKPPPPHL